MTKALASLVSLALVAALSATGAFACPCGADDASPAMSCHEPEAGFHAAPMSCGCACLSSAPASRPPSRPEPTVPTAAGVHAAAPMVAVHAARRPVLAVDAAETPPRAPSRHRILRI